MATNFTTRKKSREPINFTLDGETYRFQPPKMASAVLPAITDGSPIAMTKATLDWLGSGLTDTQMNKLRTRLLDPGDDLDIDELGDIAEGLMEEVSGGRPPMSSAGTSEPPTTTGQSSTDGASPTESTTHSRSLWTG